MEVEQHFRIESDSQGVYARIYRGKRRTSCYVDLTDGKHIDTLPGDIQNEARKVYNEWMDSPF